MITSRLAWRLGFGWFSIFILFLFLSGVLFTQGVIKVISIIFLVNWVLWLVNLFYMWNGSKWRRVHYRGMRLYSALAGEEQRLSNIEDREFNILNPCSKLVAILTEEDAYLSKLYVQEIYENKETYLKELFLEFQDDLLPKVPKNIIATKTTEDFLSKFKFGPVFIITRLIENKHGRKEAARYVIQLITGGAK